MEDMGNAYAFILHDSELRKGLIAAAQRFSGSEAQPSSHRRIWFWLTAGAGKIAWYARCGRLEGSAQERGNGMTYVPSARSLAIDSGPEWSWSVVR
jgi:hypothetical protein